MASFESHPLFSYLKYQPAHALLLIQSGARCRVCAVLYDGNNKQLGWGGSFCTAHMPDETWFSDFIQACCRMQDGLKQFCKQIPPPSTVRPWAPLFGMTASELWWWEMLNVFQLKCEISLVKLSAWWETLLEEGWCSTLGGPIVEILEIKIAPPAYWHFSHCAFAIHLVSDGWWVFDPTGVQFGPDWPLLSPLDHFLERTRSTHKLRQDCRRFRSLGTSRSLVRLGRPAF
ncbi:hypothetical protein ST47_g3046 [Ascochyta rabiei]|uniref:Uncharacterized protein n=1 Tax=Didymella rabiei TaxID=5454 RepID=A0A163IGS4_DIDRA|nr:hypothetical protein ST47_g3046 [Ascochyta rabiei]